MRGNYNLSNISTNTINYANLYGHFNEQPQQQHNIENNNKNITTVVNFNINDMRITFFI